MTDVSPRHPADILAMALQRSQVLLSTIGELFDPELERFVGGEAFTAHAVTTASQMLNEAKNALTELHYSCDLTLLDEANEITADHDADFETGPDELVKQYSDEEVSSAASADLQESDGDFAQSYLELLRKLTAAEVFAAESQALSAPGTESELLPLLKSLREDLQKIHSAA